MRKLIKLNGMFYDTRTNSYIRTYVISKNTSLELFSLIRDFGLNVYTNVIIDDTLLIYYENSEDETNQKLLKDLKASPFRNYINRTFDGNELVVYFMILDKQDKVLAFYDELIMKGYDKYLKINCYPSDDYAGYSYIKIYNKNATKENMLFFLKEKYDIKNSVTFGTIEGKYDILVHDQNLNETVRTVRKMYEPIYRWRR